MFWGVGESDLLGAGLELDAGVDEVDGEVGDWGLLGAAGGGSRGAGLFCGGGGPVGVEVSLDVEN